MALSLCVAFALVVSLRAVPMTLLQTSSQTSTQHWQGLGVREGVPTNFFEDTRAAESAAAELPAPAARQLVAPFDVGDSAVPLPNAFESEHPWRAPSPSVRRVVPNSGRPYVVSLAEARPSLVGSSQTFFDSDFSDRAQAFSGLPPGAAPQTVLQQYAASANEDAIRRTRLLARQAAMENAAQEAARQEQAMAQRAAMIQQQAATQAPEMDVKPQPLQLPQPPQSQRQEHMQEPDADAATSFFESVGDLAGQDPHGAAAKSFRSQPQASFAQMSAGQTVAAGGGAASATQQTSAVAVKNNGHSMASPYEAYTGERGEDVQTFQNPNLMKLMFPSKPEPMLAEERKIMEAQDNLAHQDADAKKAFAKLKAATYHSANMTRYRLVEQQRLETDLRRMQLLADANRYKVLLEKTAQEKSEENAGFERTLHLAGASADREREARRLLDKQLREELEARTDANNVSKQSNERYVAELRALQQEAQNREAQFVNNVSSALASAGPEGLERAAANYQAWSNRVDNAEAAKNQQDRDFQYWFNAADQAAAKGSGQASLLGASRSLALAAELSNASVIEGPTAPHTSGLGEHVLGDEGLRPMALQDATRGTPATLVPSMPVYAATGFGSAWSGVAQAATSPQNMVLDTASVPIGQGNMLEAGAREQLSLSQNDAVRVHSDSNLVSTELCRGAGCPVSGSVTPEFADSQGKQRTFLPTTYQSTSASAFQPASTCTPQCTWKCESAKCDEVCKPVCQQPKCETRCSSPPDLSGCHMECDEPQCAVTCPERSCPGSGCPTCEAHCNEPACKLQCPNDQPCRNMCEQPQCTWECSAPTECPAPKCTMVCEHPKDCAGGTYQELPPLKSGESSVASFTAPVSLRQVSATAKTDAAPLSTNLRGGTSLMQVVKPAQTVTVPVVTAEGIAERLSLALVANESSDTASASTPPATTQRLVEMPVKPSSRPQQPQVA